MTRRTPPLKALRAFESAARRGSLAAAGEELCVTASAVGHQIKGLGNLLGTQLFTAQGRARRLTESGARFAADLRVAFDQIDHACRSLERFTGKIPLRVNVTPTFAIRWLVPRLARF